MSDKNSRTESSPSSLVSLPVELVVKIVRSLSAGRFTIASTCQLMKDIVHNVVGYNRLKLKHISDVHVILKQKALKENTYVNCTALECFKKQYSMIFDHEATFIKGCKKFSRVLKSAVGIRSPQSIIKDLAGIKRISFFSQNISDDVVTAMAGVHTIELAYCEKITDVGVAALSGVHTINLSETNVTNKGVKELAGVHTIYLRKCYFVGDEGIIPLKGVHTIDATSTNITDVGVKVLAEGGVRNIGLESCKVTNNSAIALAGVHTVRFYGCRSLNDTGVKALSGVHTISIQRCTEVTNEGIKALAGVHWINLEGCKKITDEGIKALVGVHTIDISGTNITDDGVKALIGTQNVIRRY